LRLRWLVLLALAPLALPAFAGEPSGAAKDAPPPEPIAAPPTPLADMMLDVQRLQARMAKGDKDAYAAQRVKIKEVGAAIAAAGKDAFKVKAERDAVIVYLLSGGQPRDIGGIVQRGDFPEAERGMLSGAAGYTAGRQDDAAALLPYNPRAESLRLGSQLAYAQSVLMTPKDAAKSIELLDLARVLGPGTLVEEAALRREVLLVGDLRQPERLAFLARQYVERFGKSLYAGNFVAALSETVVRYDLCANADDLAKFSALLNVAQSEQSRTFLLAVSRASLLLGRFEVASLAARSALKIAPPGSPDAGRALLYDIAARFSHMEDAEAKAALAGVPIDKLTTQDRDLLAAATYVQGNLYNLPPLTAYMEIWREASVAAARSPDLPEAPPDAATATIRRAAAAVDAARSIRGQDIR
jgi:chemotaxis protein MotC